MGAVIRGAVVGQSSPPEGYDVSLYAPSIKDIVVLCNASVRFITAITGDDLRIVLVFMGDGTVDVYGVIQDLGFIRFTAKVRYAEPGYVQVSGTREIEFRADEVSVGRCGGLHIAPESMLTTIEDQIRTCCHR